MPLTKTGRDFLIAGVVAVVVLLILAGAFVYKQWRDDVEWERKCNRQAVPGRVDLGPTRLECQ